jgi:curli biogenesis system outer membrane secretion channel CsgG
MSTERSSIGGGFIPIIGGFTRTTQTADIGMDMKIIDVNRAKVVESKTFVANNETSSTKWGGAAFGGIGFGGGGMSSIKGTPMEPIVRDILARVASFASTRLVDLRVASGGTVERVPQIAPPVQASVVVDPAQQ